MNPPLINSTPNIWRGWHINIGFLFYKVCSPTPWPIREYIGGSILVLRVSIFPNYLFLRRSKFIVGCTRSLWIDGSYSNIQFSCPELLIVLTIPTSGIEMHLCIISWGYFLFLAIHWQWIIKLLSQYEISLYMMEWFCCFFIYSSSIEKDILVYR